MRSYSYLAIAAFAIAGCGDNLPGPGAAVMVISPTTGLHTTEGGGTTTFTVALTEAPAGTVQVDLSSSNVAEGTVSPATLAFDATNFAIPLTVTVRGVDDDLDDGDQAYQVFLAAGGAERDVDVTNDDNDGVGATVTPTAGLMTTEGGGSAEFTVVLDAEPLSDVTIPVSSDLASEATVEPATLTFTPVNWRAPQTVTVTGVDDAVADGARSYEVVLGAAASGDPGYEGLDPDDVTATNIDDDSPGVIVTPTSGLLTTEAGSTAEFSVVLASQPTADVTIDLTSSDGGEGASVEPRLTFTTENWDAPQVVTVRGADDLLDDGDQTYTIVLALAASTDPGYAGVDPDDVAVTNVDDEAPGFTVTPTSGLVTTEAGGTATFTVALVSAPTAPVTVQLSTSAMTEGNPSPAMLTFTPADFAVPRTVTVTGADDAVADGNQPYQILVEPATSTDPAYQGLDPPDVAATNTDNDSPGITVTPTVNLLVSELGDTARFTVVLNSQPTANVSIGLTSNDLTEGTLSTPSVTFTPANWNVAQTVTVTGVDDAVTDGNQVFTIITAAATSTDPRYNGINPPNVGVTCFDDDVAAVVVRAPPLLEVSEAGTTATFSMVLTTQPTADVRCSVVSSNTNEGTINPLFTIFTPADFDQDHTFTITGVDDTADDGNQLFIINTVACTSTDSAYSGVNPRDVNVRNLDND